MKNLSILIVGSFVLSAIGCSASQSGAPSDAANNQTLHVRGDCSFDRCGVPPSSLESEPALTCDSAPGESCNWSAASSSTSYRFCADSECPLKPQVDCPADTVSISQQCGSENDGPCQWTSTCVPPRNTTPCPDSHGCDGIPLIEIGIICSDGSTGAFACVTDGQRCKYERNCD